MSPLAAALPSPCCQADWACINPGAVSSTHLVGVVACVGCGISYSLRADLRVLAGQELYIAEPTRRRLPTEVVDQLAERARVLIEEEGSTVLGACELVGIDRTSYYRRERERRTA